MTEEDLEIALRDIGDNTHTAKLLKKGDWPGALLYIKLNDLDKSSSFEARLGPGGGRAAAYARLAQLLEGDG